MKTARRIKDGTTTAVPKMVQTTAKFTATALKTGVKGIVATGKAVTSSAKALAATITTGGGIAVLAIMIICLIGLTVGSCFGIFFSGEDTGTGRTMPAVVREINQDYEDRLNEIKSTAHDALEMSGSCASWTEALAVYAVKTTTDPNCSQEVATTDDDRKELLKEIFWSMNEISSRTEIHTTEAGDGTEITTTLYITVTHKTAEEMAVMPSSIMMDLISFA